jgi:hypothetical protein
MYLESITEGDRGITHRPGNQVLEVQLLVRFTQAKFRERLLANNCWLHRLLARKQELGTV